VTGNKPQTPNVAGMPATTESKKRFIMDFLGNEIKIGDNVVFMQVGYRNLMNGVVKSVSKQKILITHEKTNYGNESIQFQNQVIVIK
jgi:hypothetical protein